MIPVVLTLPLLTSPAWAQEAGPTVDYPTLKAKASDARGFVPAGWRLEASVRGDLDGNGSPDLAFVLRQARHANLVAAPMCENPLDTNPRILAVALAGPGAYRLVVQDHRLIPRRDNACAADPFGQGALRVERGTLRLHLERFMSAGGWSAGITSFTFRWQQSAMRLIGYDFSNVQRNTGEAATISINYLTRRAKLVHGDIAGDDGPPRWKRLPGRPLLRLDQIGDGIAFDPEGLLSRL